jgi:hypothetical protein
MSIPKKLSKFNPKHYQADQKLMLIKAGERNFELSQASFKL